MELSPIIHGFFPPVMSMLGLALAYLIYQMNECCNRIDDHLEECLETIESMRATLRSMR